MSPAEALSLPLLVAGAFFYFAGTVGVLRFGDVHSRLHAVTKADNLGLGLIVFGLAIRAGSPPVIAKLILIWVLTLTAAATAAYVIANHVARRDERGTGEPSR